MTNLLSKEEKVYKYLQGSLKAERQFLVVTEKDNAKKVVVLDLVSGGRWDTTFPEEEEVLGAWYWYNTKVVVITRPKKPPGPNKVYILDFLSGFNKLVATINYTRWVYPLDYPYLLVGSTGLVRIWDLREGKEISVTEGKLPFVEGAVKVEGGFLLYAKKSLEYWSSDAGVLPPKLQYEFSFPTKYIWQVKDLIPVLLPNRRVLTFNDSFVDVWTLGGKLVHRSNVGDVSLGVGAKVGGNKVALMKSNHHENRELILYDASSNSFASLETSSDFAYTSSLVWVEEKEELLVFGAKNWLVRLDPYSRTPLELEGVKRARSKVSDLLGTPRFNRRIQRCFLNRLFLQLPKELVGEVSNFF